jgi:hypothetical protein
MNTRTIIEESDKAADLAAEHYERHQRARAYAGTPESRRTLGAYLNACIEQRNQKSHDGPAAYGECGHTLHTRIGFCLFCSPQGNDKLI